MPLLLTFDFPPDVGGIQFYARRLAEELHGLGRPLVVLAPSARGGPASDARLGVDIRRFWDWPKQARLIPLFARLLTTRRVAGDRQTIAMSWLPGFAAAIAPRIVRGSLTVIAHGTELDVRPGSLRDRLMRFVFSRADVTVADSSFVARRLRALKIAEAPVVICPGVDDRGIPPERAAAPTVLFVGRLVARKGADRLIEAISILGRDDVILHIVGDGPERAGLEAQALRAGLGDRVRFSGRVDDAARDRAFGQAWCLAMPSRAIGGDVEGFGIVYLEAAVAGIPAVGGRGSGADDAIVDGTTGFLVDGDDAGAIAAAIAAILDDPERARRMGESGQSRAIESFSWRANARRFLQTACDTAGKEL